MRRYKLSNGMTVYHKRTKEPTIAISATVRVGSNYENKDEYGISHFMEHMLFEGTANRTALEISSAIEGIGGEIGAYTSNERTNYYIKCLKRHFRKSLEILGDIIKNPLFSQKAIEKERTVILSEVNLRKDEPRFYQWDLFISNIFKGLPPGHPIIGYSDIIKKISKQKLLDFFSRHYQPNNIILTVVGGDKPVIGEVKKAFGSLKPGLVKPLKYSYPKAIKKRIVRDKREIKQAYSVIGYRTVPLSRKDAVVLDVIRSILGRGLSGRLFDEIRNKRGLAYDIGAHHNPGVAYGFFAMYVGCEKEKLRQCKKLMLEQLDCAADVSKKELSEAKNFLEGEFIMENEDNQRRADYIGLYEYAGCIEEYKNYIKRMKQVTKQDIKRVSGKYLKSDYLQVVISN